MIKPLATATALAALLGLCACSSMNGSGQSGGTTAATPAATAQSNDKPSSKANKREVTSANGWKGYVEGTPAQNSRFGRLQIGMSWGEALSIAGQPNDRSGHVTGKAWIPFYFGSGKVEQTLYYRGMGRLIFSSDGGLSTNAFLIGIENDTSERGFAQ